MMDASTNVAPVEFVGQFILARLLVPARKAPSSNDIRKSLFGLFNTHFTESHWKSVYDAVEQKLLRDGMIDLKPPRLTASGRANTLSFWRISAIPVKNVWNAMMKKYLVPALLRVPPGKFDGKSPSDSLATFLAARELGIQVEVSTPAQLIEALAWKQLRLDRADSFSAKKVVAKLVLEREDGKDGKEKLVKDLARAKIGGNRSSDLFTLSSRQWATKFLPSADELLKSLTKANEEPNSIPLTSNDEDKSVTRSGETKSLDLQTQAVHGPSTAISTFALQVLEAARQTSTGRFGENKVFISHVWRRMHEQLNGDSQDLEAFKQRLMVAFREGSLELCRADLVSVMDPRDVRDSETRYLDAVFHFICV